MNIVSSERIAVLDIGKSNIKLSVCTYLGEVVETFSTPNDTCDAKPWKYHNLKKINLWVLKNLSNSSMASCIMPTVL